ncbi:hypothetical protein V8B97DRAFT_2025400 [Scleroderma yunnanense]
MCVLQHQVIDCNECLLWCLPTELLLLIADVSPADSLQALMQVCRLFQELAGPHYLKVVGLDILQANGWLRLNDVNCSGLLVWRHLSTFVVIPRVFLSFINSPTKATAALGSLLQSILTSKCERLTCYALQVTFKKSPCLAISSKLSHLDISSPLMFKPACIAFTLSVLQNMLLTHLSIMKMSFNPRQWSLLLSQVKLPQLASLEIDMDCPTLDLVLFLAYHQFVTNLTFSHHGTPPRQLGPSHRSISSIDLPHLVELAGSPTCLLPLLLCHLTVHFDELKTTDLFFSTILSCVDHLLSLPELDVFLPHTDSEDKDILVTCLASPDLNTWISSTLVLCLKSYSQTPVLACPFTMAIILILI